MWEEKSSDANPRTAHVTRYTHMNLRRDARDRKWGVASCLPLWEKRVNWRGSIRPPGQPGQFLAIFYPSHASFRAPSTPLAPRGFAIAPRHGASYNWSRRLASGRERRAAKTENPRASGIPRRAEERRCDGNRVGKRFPTDATQSSPSRSFRTVPMGRPVFSAMISSLSRPIRLLANRFPSRSVPFSTPFSTPSS